MRDILLEKFFEMERWEKVIDIGIGKDIDKGELRKLCSPEVRLQMLHCILNDNYEIAPPHQAKIPKDNGDYRIVYVNENADRLFLSIVNDLLLEMLPEMIHPSCKSYQKGIGCGKIVQEVTQKINIKSDSEIGIKADLTKYFDSVPIRFINAIFDEIEEKLGKSKIIGIVRKYYNTDYCFDVDGNLIEHYQSLKQGCAVASFLANVVLYHCDDTMSKLDGYYVRYSDDLLYIGPNPENAMMTLQTELNKMKLALNPKKVEYLYRDRWFKFLGFNIKGTMITLSKNRVKTFQKEIENRTIKDFRHVKTAEKALNNVNKYLYIGDGKYSWATNVLPIINVQKDIDELNMFVMDCIRACGTGKKKLGGLGVVYDKDDHTILRGKGKNVTANRQKECKALEQYKGLTCMRKVILTNRDAFETVVRCM